MINKTIVILILIVVLFGYTNNIVKLSSCDFAEPYVEEVIRLVGIAVQPLGIVLGYMNFER